MKSYVLSLAVFLATTPLLAHNVTWNPNPMILDLAVSKLGTLHVTHLEGEKCIVKVDLTPTGPLAVFFASNPQDLDVTALILPATGDMHVGDRVSATISGSWHATGQTSDGKTDPTCDGSGPISIPVTVTRSKEGEPDRLEFTLTQLILMGGDPSGSAAPVGIFNIPKSAPFPLFPSRSTDGPAAAAGALSLLVAEKNDQLEIVNFSGPCAPGAACPPNPPPQTVAVGSNSIPLRACTNDVNGDGLPDLCTFTKSGQFCEFVAQRDGSYRKTCTTLGGSEVSDAVPFSCSATGATTCVVATQPAPDPLDPSWQVLSFIASATGALTPKATLSTFPNTVGRGPLAVADLNGDGKGDLVTANTDRNTVSVLLGDGTGSFSAATNFPVGTSPVALVVSDVNSDGKPDIVVANSGSKNVSVLLGDGTGKFAAPKNFTLPGIPAGMAIGDLNLDGKPDIAVAYPALNSVDVFFGDGAGGFQPAYTSGIEGTPVSVVIADFDGDTKPDLAVINASFPSTVGTQNVSIRYNSMLFPICKLTGTPAINAVFNAASYQANVSGNAIIGITGSGFQPAGQTYLAGSSDLVKGAFPTILSCVAVELDGNRAPIIYTSGGQINAQAPASLTPGPETVRVILNPDSANAIPSNFFSVPAQAVSPAFFTFDGKSIAAVDALSGTIVADPAVVPGAAPAKPGQILSLYGTGFGATKPAYLEGQIASGAAPLAAPLTVSIGGVTLAVGDVLYGGLAPGFISGLYQFNVRLPDAVPDGSQPVAITTGGQQTQSGATLTVKR